MVYGFNGIIARTRSFGLTNDLSSGAFSAPRRMETLTIYAPACKTATTYKLETLTPPLASDVTEVWTTVNWVNDPGASNLPVINALSTLGTTAAQTIVLTSSHVGGGSVLRITFSAAQDIAVVFTMLWGFAG